MFRLSLMMFLEYMALPVWFVPVLPYVASLPEGENWTLACGMIMGIGTLASPLIGMFADRYLNAEKVLRICYLVSAGFLTAAFFTTSPAVLFFLLLGAMLSYVPTWSVTTVIAMAHSSADSFARIRVFGTIGWVASGIFSLLASAFGYLTFDTSRWIFAAGVVVSIAAAVVTFALQATPPAAKGTALSVVDALGLRALSLFRDPRFRAFVVLLTLAMIPFQWYNVYCAQYLKESGFKYLTLTMNLGQAGEVGFMLLVPLIIRRWGYRGALVIALSALAFRNASLAVSSACGLVAFDFGAIIVHGLIFGLLIVGGQMFVGEVAPSELRNQAQGLVMTLTCGIGVFLSNLTFDSILRSATPTPWTFAYITAFAIAAALAVCACIPRRI